VYVYVYVHVRACVCACACACWLVLFLGWKIGWVVAPQIFSTNVQV
jgi:hypothetical protein